MHHIIAHKPWLSRTLDGSVQICSKTIVGLLGLVGLHSKIVYVIQTCVS